MVTVIYPYKRGTPEPKITREGDAIVVSAGSATDRIEILPDRVRFKDRLLLPKP